VNPKDKAALRQWRTRQGLGLGECARRLGVSSRSLHRWEGRTRELNHGRTKVFPPPRMLMLLVAHDIRLPPA
jgi:DNA-binding transcriptional regulator YiaG